MKAICKLIVFNHSLSNAALVAHNSVLRSHVVEVKNVTVPSGERFYHVLVSDIIVVNILV